MEKTFDELNQIFWDASIKRGALEVDGTKVTKSLARHPSNSGKSYDWEVSFSWIDVDGKPRSLTKESRFKDNRRNDADRNWGLGPE